ncbi:MAG: hypothetical protein ACUVQ8_00405 [Nitrososphaeria archaeon]
MNRRKAAAVYLIAIVMVSIFLTWQRIEYLYYSQETAHDTYMWAVIEDSKGKHIAVETQNDKTWEELRKINENKTRLLVGGIIEKYDNKWGFRFKPDTVTLSPYPAKESQGTIEEISNNIDYWRSKGIVYVYSKVTEIHIILAVSNSTKT